MFFIPPERMSLMKRSERREREWMEEAEGKENGTPAAQTSGGHLPVIAIVGRPNVGKSSLFNSILKRRHAIVHFDSGVTRDRVSAPGVYDGRRFNLIDTGGLGMYSGQKKNLGFWDQAIEQQVEAALDDAVTILFVVDVMDGLTELDKAIAARLRTCSKKVLLVANKADNYKGELAADEFHALGFEKIFPVSSLHRKGINEVLDAALAGVPQTVREGDKAPRPLRISVLGRPNVGKSSLVNKLLGQKRVIVSEVAGTTRDAIDIEFTLKCHDEDVPALLVDTAGLRKRSKVDGAVEHYSIMRAEEAMNTSDIVLFVVEAAKDGMTSQDKTIARMIEDSGKGCIIVANKWDECSGQKQKDVFDEIRRTLPQMEYAPVVFTCALSGYNFNELYETIAELRAQMSVKISTSMVNRVIGDAQDRNAAPVVGTKPFKIYYGTMVDNPPPRFSLFVNDPKLCADNYKTYLENYIRRAFEFIGFPIKLHFKERKRKDLNEIIAKKTPKHDKHEDKKFRMPRAPRKDEVEESEAENDFE